MSVLNNVAFLPIKFDSKLFPGELSLFLSLCFTHPSAPLISVRDFVLFRYLQAFPPTSSLTQDGSELML